MVSIDNIFPYDNMRDNQKKGIETVFDTCSEEGFVLLEGACGTGKTLLSLCPLLYLLDTSEKYERIVIATSVKQQQKPIENEIRNINKNTSNNYTAVSLVGKADMCSFVDGGKIDRRDIYSRCDELRKGTMEINKNTEQDYSDLVDQSVRMNNKDFPDNLQSEENKFSDKRIPRDDETQTQFCPFYANYLDKSADTDDPVTPFSGKVGLVDPDNMLEKSSKQGICPYSAMSEMTTKADVIICNYYHVFDSRTSKSMMKNLIDDKTLVIFDEAHNLVNKTRDLMEKRQSIESLRNTITEIEDVIKLLSVDKEKAKEVINNPWGSDSKEYIKNKLEDLNIEFEDESQMAKAVIKAHKVRGNNKLKKNKFIDIVELFEDLLDTIDKIITDNQPIEDSEDIPLRNPEKLNKDKISFWLDSDPSRKSLFKNREEVLNTVVEVLSTMYIEILPEDKVPEFSTSKTIEFWKSWEEENNKDYFRSLKVKDRFRESGQEVYDWEKKHKVYLMMNNCLPKDNISDVITDFGGGVLMSATLEPLDVFKRETGMDEKNIKVEETQFGLEFPEENRKSLSVNLPKFKYNNRGRTFDNGSPNMNSVRRKYLESIIDFTENVEGNSMVVMQSYLEAKWVYKMLLDRSNFNQKDLILDESSSNKETETKKQEFYSGGEKVLITGARGTLVEGVDYMGERLRGIAVCGVPLKNTNNPVAEAIRTSYDREFGNNNGFNYAFTIPAVRKTRQTIGRLIRDENDYGVRLLMDERYCKMNQDWDNVREYLSEQEREEFKDISKDSVEKHVSELFESFS